MRTKNLPSFTKNRNLITKQLFNSSRNGSSVFIFFLLTNTIGTWLILIFSCWKRSGGEKINKRGKCKKKKDNKRRWGHADKSFQIQVIKWTCPHITGYFIIHFGAAHFSTFHFTRRIQNRVPPIHIYKTSKLTYFKFKPQLILH